MDNKLTTIESNKYSVGNSKSKRIVFNKEDIKRALEENNGIITYAARALEVKVLDLTKIIEADKELKETAEIWRAHLQDLALRKLLEGVQKGDARLIMFTLETIGKDKGFTKRTEVTGKDGGTVEVDLLKNKLRAEIEKKAKEKAEGVK